MSEFSEGSNPYEASQQVPPASGKPAGLTAICIINIVLGAAGLLAVCLGGAGLAAGPAAQQWAQQVQVEGQGEEGPGLRMQSEINQFNVRYRPYSIVVLLAHLVVAALLLWGGIQALRLREGGAKVLIVACAVAIAFEVLRGIGNTILQLQMLGVMEQHLPELAAGADGGMTANFTRVMMYIGLGCGFFWLIAKVVFYGVSIAYLRKPHIRALFKTAH